MPKRTVATFLFGLLSGSILVGFIWFASILGKGFQNWGKAEVYFDEDARKCLVESKLRPSDSAQDIFYFIDGFQDHRVFVAYTDSDENINATVLAMTGKPVKELEAWRNQLDTGWQFWPGITDAKFPRSLYAPQKVKKGRVFMSPLGSNGWYLIIDDEAHRLYFGSWET